MERSRISSVMAIAACIGVLALLVYKTQSASTAEHDHISERTRHMLAIDARVDHHVILARDGFLLDYDPLVAMLDDLERTSRNARKASESAALRGDDALRAAVGGVDEVLAAKRRGVDRFMSSNAVFRNSIAYLPVALGALSTHDELRHPASELLRDVLLYDLVGSAEVEADVRRDIDAIERDVPPARARDVEHAVAHAKLVLRVKPERDQAIADLLALPGPRRLAALDQAIHAHRARDAREANGYRILLGVVSALLAVAITAAVLRLRRNAMDLEVRVAERTRELREQGARLAQALEDQRRTQAQLVQAQKLEAIGSLAAGVAHEINTPVQYVSDNVTFLGRAFEHLAKIASAAKAATVGASDAARPELAEIERAIEKSKLDFVLREMPGALGHAREGLARIAAIVGAMKEFAHPSSRDKELVDLARTIAATITVASSEWKRVATVATHFDPDLPLVPALRNDLSQVILNLLVNAAHAIADATDGGARGPGEINITTRRANDRAVIEVSDTGTGIPEPIRDRIFDPFFTTKPVGKGTGQGLAIAYNVVVERHGGTIDVQSEVGKGTTFVIQLPMTTTPAASQQARSSESPRAAA